MIAHCRNTGAASRVPFVDPETRTYLDDMRREMTRRFDGVDQRFVQLEAELRRHFGVLIEQGRHKLQVVAEMVVANTEAIADLRTRLDAR
jgi:hypothetical protein